MRIRLVVVAAFVAATTASQAQAPATATPESLVLAAKRAAGQDYAGTFLRICVAPDNLATGTGVGGRGAANAAPAARVVPDRATWYAQPYKVFDNLYFIGTRIHSAWALTTSDGIIVIDTLFDYAIEPEIVEGLSGLGLNPRDIKYVVISHAHGDHDQGAALLQSRYGAKVVMGVPDWDATVQRPSTAAGGVPKRDVGVGPEGRKITLGDTTIDVIATPGHTPGTLSMVFRVRDNGTTHTVAYWGGNGLNADRESLQQYIQSAQRFSDLARQAGADVMMSNHTDWDGSKAYLPRLRPRPPGSANPYVVGAQGIARYLDVARECATARLLRLN